MANNWSIWRYNTYEELINALDGELADESLSNMVRELKGVNPELRNNLEFFKKLKERYPDFPVRSLETYATGELKETIENGNDNDVIIFFNLKIRDFQNSNELLDNKEFMLKYLENEGSGDYYFDLSDRLKGDKDIIFTVAKYGNRYEFLDDISEFIIEGNEVISENYQEEESSELASKEEQYYYKLRGLVKGINFINNYFKIKGEVKNEKYIILFTDIVNVGFYEEDQIKKIMNDLCVNKGIIFILVGKIENTNIKGKKSKLEELIINKFGEKSEIIYFENINKIKTILSNKNVIKDEIISPNEIY